MVIEVSLVEPQGQVFLEEVWLKIMMEGAGQVEVLLRKEMVGEELVVAPQKRGEVEEELVVALLKTEKEASQVGAERLVEKVASQVGACQVVALK